MFGRSATRAISVLATTLRRFSLIPRQTTRGGFIKYCLDGSGNNTNTFLSQHHHILCVGAKSHITARFFTARRNAS